MESNLMNNDFLPVPVPSSADDSLPQSSEFKVFAQSVFPVFFHSNDNWHRFSVKFGQYISTSDPLFQAPHTAPHYAWFEPPFPANVQLVYQAHWELIECFKLTGPQAFERTVTWTRGSSTTDSSSFSAELGASLNGLSAKLSATTQHSITVTDTSTETQKFNFKIPAGKVIVIAFWQLVETFKLIDGSGNPVTYHGLWRIHDDGGDGNQALAWIDTNQLVNRALTLCVNQTEFNCS